ncbi:PIN-like domain-containing protein [Actinomadura kijaniata]|uniref:PIN-like domain-containing protein n=1 Tax=Actinomadura kijaniata TaxID=46161 RepID=UPI00082CFE3D|nr:PIN-like domain-containing protein [Actinomadura kijaniata]
MLSGQAGTEWKLLQQYRAWIQPDSSLTEEERKGFFTDGTIVLDTNVLLDLYRYTPNTRRQLLAVLGQVSGRLWMPYQVGLEFVRGRAGVIQKRVDALHKAPNQVSLKFGEAWKRISEAVTEATNLLEDYAGNQAADGLNELISESRFKELMDPWRTELVNRIKRAKEEGDFGSATFTQGQDTLLPQIAALYGDRIGEPPGDSLLRERVELATSFRFPNKIPPGSEDGGKGTDLGAAGDFLLWEEMIAHAEALPPGTRVVLVSRDTKRDWYQPKGFGQEERPWPGLIDEFEKRTEARLLIVETAAFYADVTRFLGAQLATSTIDELNRPAPEPADDQPFLSQKDLAQRNPGEDLALAAYRAAGLSSKAIRQALTRPSDRLFQWWLIGATRDLELRDTGIDEPLFDLQAVLREEAHPGPGWSLAADILQPGELPYMSVFIAPWFASILKASPLVDRTRLLRLAHQHGSATGFGAPDEPRMDA